MKNPFVTIPEDRRPELAERWVQAGALPNEASGWDLFTDDREWGIYPVGQVKAIARIAGIRIEIVDIDLKTLLNADFMRETFEHAWLDSVASLDEVYMEDIFDYIETRDLNAENHIRITQFDAG